MRHGLGRGVCIACHRLLYYDSTQEQAHHTLFWSHRRRRRPLVPEKKLGSGVEGKGSGQVQGSPSQSIMNRPIGRERLPTSSSKRGEKRVSWGEGGTSMTRPPEEGG